MRIKGQEFDGLHMKERLLDPDGKVTRHRDQIVWVERVYWFDVTDPDLLIPVVEVLDADNHAPVILVGAGYAIPDDWPQAKMPRWARSSEMRPMVVTLW